MSQISTYELEPYRLDLDVVVTATGDDQGRPFAVLDDTLLYPEGGGQPADRGRLGSAAVVDVQRHGDSIRHLLDSPIGLGPAKLVVDWPRRYDHMQQHTSQHLLTAVALRRFGWRTTAFHLREEASDVELDVAAPAAGDLETLEEAVNAEIHAGRPVRARRVSPEEFARLDVRTRGLPAGHRGDVRLVEIEGADVNTCGGTHLRSTAEIGTLKLLGTESIRGGTRLHWVAGGRVRRRLAAHEARNAELRKVLGASDDEFVEIVSLKLDQLRDANRLRKRLEKQLAEAVGESFLHRAEPLVEAHFEDAEMGFLQQIARLFSASDHSGLAFLTATSSQGACFVVAAGGGCAADAQEAGRSAAEALGGRGGGSGRLFQGKAESLARREDVVRAIAAAP